MIVLIDNGHGNNTKGKCSPDGNFKEYKFNRIIADMLHKELSYNNIESFIIVPEEIDIPLKERCNRVNSFVKSHPNDNVILISIHANAFGYDWNNVSGFEIYTSKGETKADKLADCIFNAVKSEFPDIKLRTDYSDGDSDKEEAFYILKHTVCPAVLTENFFYTNHSDLALLTSEEGLSRITKYHVNGIIDYKNKVS